MAGPVGRLDLGILEMKNTWPSSLLLLFTYLLVKLATVSECLQLSMDVDTPIIAGEGGWLRCDWDLEDDSIYAVKWYWGVSEFYRWTPKAENPVLVFKNAPFNVDMARSTKGHVFIKDVKLKATGLLRCEVSSEGPQFYTDYKEERLAVVDLPDSRPNISGSLSVYQVHQDVALTCTSPRSKPAASLFFYINGEMADPSWLIPHLPQVDPISRLETASLSLRFPLRPRLLDQGKTVVKCIASLENVYWESGEKVILADVPLRASRMEERASSSSSSSAGGGGGPASRGSAASKGVGLMCASVLFWVARYYGAKVL